MPESWNIIDLRLRAYELASQAGPVGATHGETLEAANILFDWITAAQVTTGQGVPVPLPPEPEGIAVADAVRGAIYQVKEEQSTLSKALRRRRPKNAE